MVHEWALAEAVSNYVLSKFAGGGLPEKSVRLKIGFGELQAVDKEIFTFALKEILHMNGVTLSNLEIVELPARFKCRRCGFEWTLRDTKVEEEVREAIHFVPEVVHSYLTCPSCGSRDFEVIAGRGIDFVEVFLD
ncbi:MAG: hypothetical protein B7O98_00285 [Zestosphaera tikiterensis]|uniref:Hydrogenase maturation factor HypA n=1 Tax=Zestosphaera tikiterensis TaxID=1973259 RepID=A0A2R7Y8T9_9CREN|nr:MAG: hypothetical protein B7O98_00285 [Zestosphaera tikiterensis]